MQISFIDGYLEENLDSTEPIHSLIDISGDKLDDQLLEIEKLTTIDEAATTAAVNNKLTPTTSNSGDNLVDLLDTSGEHEKFLAGFPTPLLFETNNKTSNDLFGTNDSNTLDGEWTAAFGNTSSQQFQSSTTSEWSGASNNSFLPSSLLSLLLTSANQVNQSTTPSSAISKPKPIMTEKKTDESNWFSLFAELDPIQNPNAIGKTADDEADRNC